MLINQLLVESQEIKGRSVDLLEAYQNKIILHFLTTLEKKASGQSLMRS